MVYLIYICICAPLSLMLLLLPKESRRVVGFMIIGITMCLCAGEFNTVLISYLNMSVFKATITYTPVIEEILKMLPVVFYALVISDDRQKLLTISMAVGIGFAILENTFVMVQNVNDINFLFAFVHGFGSALMHGICTATIGIGLAYIKKMPKLLFPGTFGLFACASIYHGIYNLLVQSEYKYWGFILPLLTYIPIVIAMLRHMKKVKEASE